MLPPDSQVEIDAKIAAGYFSATSAAPPNLDNVKGRLVSMTNLRTWDDLLH